MPLLRPPAALPVAGLCPSGLTEMSSPQRSFSGPLGHLSLLLHLPSAFPTRCVSLLSAFSHDNLHITVKTNCVLFSSLSKNQSHTEACKSPTLLQLICSGHTGLLTPQTSGHTVISRPCTYSLLPLPRTFSLPRTCSCSMAQSRSSYDIISGRPSLTCNSSPELSPDTQ